MEKITSDYTETHDFMNVDSFSQLPFLRPPVPLREKGIRLFGKEFGGGNTAATAPDESFATAASREDAKEVSADNNGGDSTRKFECQYCRRNFPTSQALGGHQNAHKRERQNAKRAHLQSAMIHAGGLAEAALPAHAYGLMNYHRLGAVAAPPLSYPDHWGSKNITAYNSSPSSSRFYGRNGDGSLPLINGSPLALWRTPPAHGSSTFYRHDGSMHPRPFLGNFEFKNPQAMSSNSSQTLLGYDHPKPKMQDQVSLDLHL